MALSKWSPSGQIERNQQRLEKYLKWFYLFGQNSCIPLRSTRRKSHLPQMFAFVLFILGTLVFYSEFAQLTKTEPRHKIVVRFLLWPIVIVNFFAIGKSFSMPADTHFVLHTFLRTLTDMNRQLNASMSLNDFFTAFGIKVKIIAVGQLALFGILFSSSYYTYGYHVEIYHAILLIYRIAAAAHVIFYTDLITFLMVSMKNQLELKYTEYSLHKSVDYVDRATDIVRLAKRSHFNLHSCQHVMNECFGWIIVLIVMESFLSATKSGFWAFHYAISFHFDLVRLIRKYVHLFDGFLACGH